MNRFSVPERVPLVTGGTRGLGRAMEHAFQQAGAKVIVAAHNQEHNAASPPNSPTPLSG